MEGRSQLKAQARQTLIEEHGNQLAIERGFRAKGINWHRVERELRVRKLKFTPSGLARLMKEFDVAPIER